MSKENLLQCFPVLLPTKAYMDEETFQSLYSYNDKLFYGVSGQVSENQKEYKSYYIYITSNRDIKEGDWFYHKNRKSPTKCVGIKDNGDIQFQDTLIVNAYPKGALNEWITRVELTTDYKLISDGVPSIPKIGIVTIFDGNKEMEVNFIEEFVRRYNEESTIPQKNSLKEVWAELHPRPITLSGGSDLGEEGKDWEWSVEPFEGEPIIHFI